tara:strand:+ start:141 stop:308 length:168 start_codon:yes stop_codon:yes gene_type:complete
MDIHGNSISTSICPECKKSFDTEFGEYRELENCSKMFCDEECADSYETPDVQGDK